MKATDTKLLTSSDVAALRKCSINDAERWIAAHAKRLGAWKTGNVGGQWRVGFAKLKQARLQLGER